MCVCLCGDYCSSTVGDRVMWSGVYSRCSSLKGCAKILHWLERYVHSGYILYVLVDLCCRLKLFSIVVELLMYCYSGFPCCSCLTKD